MSDLSIKTCNNLDLIKYDYQYRLIHYMLVYDYFVIFEFLLEHAICLHGLTNQVLIV